MMLNLLQFPRFCYVCYKQATQLVRTVSKRARTLSADQYRGLRRRITTRIYLQIYHTGRGEERCRRFRARFLCGV